jgi:hypothetical protein
MFPGLLVVGEVRYTINKKIKKIFKKMDEMKEGGMMSYLDLTKSNSISGNTCNIHLDFMICLSYNQSFV